MFVGRLPFRGQLEGLQEDTRIYALLKLHKSMTIAIHLFLSPMRLSSILKYFFFWEITNSKIA